MQRKEFEEQIDRLVDTYGEKNFSVERVKILWEKFKFEKVDYFRNAVSNLIAENFTAPPASKISVAIQALKESNTLKERKTYDWDCTWCGQSGFVIVGHIETGHVGVLKCKCEFADLHAKARINVFDTKLYPTEEYACKFWSMDLGSYEGPKKMMHNTSDEEGKRLAKKYYPILKEMLFSTSKSLPYDPKLRESAEVSE